MSSSEHFARSLSRIAVSQLCAQAGFDRTNVHTSETLTDLLISFMEMLIEETKCFAEWQGREAVNVSDCFVLLEHIGGDVKELKRFMENWVDRNAGGESNESGIVEPGAFPVNRRQLLMEADIPVNTTNTKSNKPHHQELPPIHRPRHIPEYFPPFPSREEILLASPSTTLGTAPLPTSVLSASNIGNNKETSLKRKRKNMDPYDYTVTANTANSTTNNAQQPTSTVTTEPQPLPTPPPNATTTSNTTQEQQPIEQITKPTIPLPSTETIKQASNLPTTNPALIPQSLLTSDDTPLSLQSLTATTTTRNKLLESKMAAIAREVDDVIVGRNTQIGTAESSSNVSLASTPTGHSSHHMMDTPIAHAPIIKFKRPIVHEENLDVDVDVEEEGEDVLMRSQTVTPTPTIPVVKLGIRLGGAMASVDSTPGAASSSSSATPAPSAPPPKIKLKLGSFTSKPVIKPVEKDQDNDDDNAKVETL